MKKKTKVKYDMNFEDIDELTRCLKNNDENAFIQLCNRIQINISKDEFFQKKDDTYYKIMEQIESNEELMSYFKKYALENKSLHIFFKYCQNTKNTRFFVDNKEKYDLANEDLEIMYDFFKRRNAVKKEEIEFESKKTVKMISIIGIPLIIIILIVMNVNFLMPLYLVNFGKNVKVVEAKVIEVNIGVTRHFTRGTEISYKYYVNDTEYSKKEHITGTTIKTKDLIKNVGNNDSVEIFYYIDNPNNSHIINFNKFYIIDIILLDIAFLGKTIQYIIRKLKNVKVKE